MPDSRHVEDAAAHIRTVVHPQIYNHSVRTFLLGREAARRDGVTDLDAESLCLAALFHDSGTADLYNGPSRFEIEGADAAAEFLQQRGWRAAMVDPIWEAIALHTSPGIAERRGPIAHYLRRGVVIEFGPPELRETFTAAIAAAEAQYARSDLEEVLQTLVIEQALAQPQKAKRPSWVADLLAQHDPGRTGVNPAF
ncbi:HD domain-containing protein [Nocardia sp. NPDC049190]|uniref:HD domain-containing protein n=1 Tax=Nocardia sp. NPDC049190 TaxID=3155650 RepID=UPI0033E9C367